MHPPAKSLFLQTAGDLMSEMVVNIPQDMSLQGAARRLTEYQVSGAPVVDDEGRCVGVISASDFVHWAGDGQKASHQPVSPGCVCASWQIVDADQYSDENRVRCFMTGDPVTVSQNTPVQKLAQMMLDAHIHRLIVVDREQRPSASSPVPISWPRLPGPGNSRRPGSSKTNLSLCGNDSSALFLEIP